MKNKNKLVVMLPLLLLSSCGGNTITSSSINSTPNTTSSTENTSSSVSSSENTSSDDSSVNSDTTSSSTSSEIQQSKKEKYKLKRETSVLGDSNYRNGFGLISPETTSAKIEGVLDYGGEAETDFYKKSEKTYYWTMCQWWTPFDFINSSFSKVANDYIYENQSRKFKVNTADSTLYMELDSDAEYEEKFGGPRDPKYSWSHFLIQQSFPKELQLPLTYFDELWVTFDFTILQNDYLGDPATKAENDCSQLLFYLRLYNVLQEGQTEEEYGRDGSNMWFGLPLLDSRYDFVPAYKAGDSGFIGATNSLIYNISSSEYFNEKLQVGKKYHIEIECMDYIKQGFLYGATNNFLPNCKYNNMYLKYMNFGWELPGEYHVASTIQNLDIYYVHE